MSDQPKAQPLISRQSPGWLSVSLGALRAPRTAIRLLIRPHNGYETLVTGRIAVQIATIAALLVVAIVIGVTIRFNIFVPWGTDSAAYISAAYRWADGQVFSPASFVFWAPWSAAGVIESPLGHVPGAIKGTIVSMYPLGYPLLLAAALELGGSLAPYVVAPLFAGLLAWCAYVIGGQFSSPWAGVMASVLVAATPVTLANAITPMSDVPATALWALGWVLALRPGVGASVAAGTTTAAAIMVRPNLAPLGAVIAAVVLVQGWPPGSRRWTRLFAFGVVAAIGPAIVLWSQAVQYGSPFSSGYTPDFRSFLSRERVVTNLALYPRLLVDLHTWLVLAAFAIVPVAMRRVRGDANRRRSAVLTFAALGVIVINYALYLPYFTYEGWYWFRFMLPAFVALVLLFAALLDRLRLLLASRSRLLQSLVVVPLLIVVTHPKDKIRQIFDDVAGYPRVQLMGRYLREALPHNAVILTFLQSGAAAFYTGRPIVRLDIGPEALDGVVADLSRRGYRPVLVIDDAMEGAEFRKHFKNSRYSQLDWPPRAEFWSRSAMSYFDFADRERFLNGERWRVDVLTWPVNALFRGSEHRVYIPPEFAFPPTHETLAFRRILEDKYRDGLRRSSAASHVDLRDSVVWTRRYIRYRVQKCAHEDAVARIITQLEGRDVPPVCGPTRDVNFPPRDEVVDFRRQLEVTFRDHLKKAPGLTHVDLEGDAVWTQEYLRYRVGNCSHLDAVERVMRQIDGGGVPQVC